MVKIVLHLANCWCFCFSNILRNVLIIPRHILLQHSSRHCITNTCSLVGTQIEGTDKALSSAFLRCEMLTLFIANMPCGQTSLSLITVVMSVLALISNP